MKILFLISKLHYSGAPKMMAWIANQMAARGHRVTLISMYDRDNSQQLSPAVTLRLLGRHKSKSRLVRNTVDLAGTLHALRQCVREEQPDAVVSFLDAAGSMFLPLNFFFGSTPVLASERVDPSARKGLLGWFRHRLLRFADGIVFQTEGARAFYAFDARIQAKSRVIPNPVLLQPGQLCQPVPFSQRDNRMVSVGRLTMKQKRYDVMLDAFLLVYRARPELRLEIYGDGKDAALVRQMIAARGLENAVSLMGKTEDVFGALRRARAFVITSDYEGIPNSLIEAMSFGVPAVATDCSPGGARLLVEHEVNGLLAPCGDAAAIARGLLRLAEDEALSNRIAQNAIQIAEKFPEGPIADQWEQALLELTDL